MSIATVTVKTNNKTKILKTIHFLLCAWLVQYPKYWCYHKATGLYYKQYFLLAALRSMQHQIASHIEIV